MAFNVYRLGRGFRAILAPLSAIIGFSCLLTFLFVLYQPTPGPGIQQRLGWQSWDVVDSTLPLADTDTSIDIGSGDDDVEAGDDMPAEDGVDWWNVTAPQDSVDSASLPLDVWAPLLPHDTGCASLFLLRSSRSSRRSIRNSRYAVFLQSQGCRQALRS